MDIWKPVSIGLCVTPSIADSTIEKWVNSSINEWIHYQRDIVGFTDVFYLDPYGEDLVLRHPELSPTLRSGLLHVPHLPVRTSFESVLSTGPVATTLALERCFMLARQRNIEYILNVMHPMDIIVPLIKKTRLLPKTLDFLR